MSDPSSSQPKAEANPVPKMAFYLGWGGTLPVLMCALLAILLESGAFINGLARAALVYGGVILSFLGGAHWGFASLNARSDRAQMAVRLFIRSVLPALLGWVLIVYNGPMRFLLMAALFLAILPLDRWAVTERFAPRWWMALRIPLSLVMAAGFVVLSFTA